MGKLNVYRELEVKVNADKAWDVIGPNFLNIGDWGPGINKSWKNEDAPTTIEGAPAGGRFCDLGKQGTADERILHYDANQREITWSAYLDSLPGFVKNLKNDLKVEMIDEDHCKVTSNISADLTGIGGIFMKGMIRKNFNSLLTVFLKDWGHYAATGEISESKKRQIARNQA